MSARYPPRRRISSESADVARHVTKPGVMPGGQTPMIGKPSSCKLLQNH
jgi:hypothetical protein